MKIAILLAVLAGAHALPTSEERASPAPGEELEGFVSLLPPPPPPRFERDIQRGSDSSEEKEKERENFISILRDLNKLARGERPQYSGGVPNNYFVIIGVFDEPELGEPILYAERLSLDDAAELSRRRRAVTVAAPSRPKRQGF